MTDFKIKDRLYERLIHFGLSNVPNKFELCSKFWILC